MRLKMFVSSAPSLRAGSGDFSLALGSNGLGEKLADFRPSPSAAQCARSCSTV